MRGSQILIVLAMLILLMGCGEQTYENAGSRHTLMEDSDACAAEIAKSPAALTYRRNPSAYPDYPFRALDDMTHCVERKGWTLVRADRNREKEQDKLNEPVATVAIQEQAVFVSIAKHTKSLTESMNERLVLATQ